MSKVVMLSDEEYVALAQKCRSLPPASGNYMVNDFVSNLLLTVVDYQQKVKAVENAFAHYKKYHWDDIRSFDDLKSFLAKYPDDKAGNIAAAQELFGYKFWTRVSQLRGLMSYFESIGVTTQECLVRWAATSNYECNFKGKVKGLGPAIYNWLVMRQGVDTIKPDVRVRKFVESVLGPKTSTISDSDLVDILKQIANALGKPAIALDWSIWEYQGAQD